VRAVSLPFGIAGKESTSHDMKRGFVRVSTKLAAICAFRTEKSPDGKDNEIAHRVQCFSHLLN
jgi:hypothetical protein